MNLETPKSVHPLRRVWRGRNFRFLAIGHGISLVGDQFLMIALPWLVLQVTGSGLALGTVLGLAAIPRAVFMLLGGAITDRFSPRTVMLISDIGRLFMTGFLGLIVFLGWIELWMIYGFALCFGLVDGFFAPAASTILPHIVDEEDLQAANSLGQGITSLSVFVGPVLAGALIAFTSPAQTGLASKGGASVPGSEGLALALAVDTFTFLVSVVTLWLIQLPDRPESQRESRPAERLLASIGEGLRYMWHDPLRRILIVLVAAANFLVVGPFNVGIPVLANTRLPEGAAAFGLIMSALAGGGFVGLVLAGILSSTRGMGLITPMVYVLFGVGIASLGFVRSTPVACIVVLAMGLGNGYVSVVMNTWLQKRTPKAILGRVMSLIIFASVGLVPVSQSLSGALVGLSLPGLFVGAGILLVLLGLRAALLPEMRSLDRELEEEPLPVQA